METTKTVIVVAGPTAVGKTSVAIRLAKRYHTSIISADSRQCYREMRIGVARPSEEELAAVPHYFIATHSIKEEVNAASFARYATEQAEVLFQQHSTIILCGGTGLYIRAFCEGLDPIPSINPSIRETLLQEYEERGLGWLQEEVRRSDPDFFAVGETQNPHRLLRALEVLRGTGQSVTAWRTGQLQQRGFRCVKLGLDLPRAALYQQIETRVDQMLEQGLVKEVEALYPHRQLKALQTVGYQELFSWMDHHLSYNAAVELIKQHTRNYAKRQLTWFRRDSGIQWFSPVENRQMDAFLDQQTTA